MTQKKLPTVLLRAGEDRRVRAGHPWAFSNEILMDAETKALPPGSLANLRAPSGEALGLVTFNPHSLIAARVLSPWFRTVPDPERRLASAERFLEEEETDSGILVSRGDGLQFWHLTFQLILNELKSAAG